MMESGSPAGAERCGFLSRTISMQALKRTVAQDSSDTDTQCDARLLVPRSVHVRLLRRLTSSLPPCSLVHEVSIAGWVRTGRVSVYARGLYAIPSLMLFSGIADRASTFLRARVHGACEHLYTRAVVRVCASKVRSHTAKRLSVADTSSPILRLSVLPRHHSPRDEECACLLLCALLHTCQAYFGRDRKSVV